MIVDVLVATFVSTLVETLVDVAAAGATVALKKQEQMVLRGPALNVFRASGAGGAEAALASIGTSRFDAAGRTDEEGLADEIGTAGEEALAEEVWMGTAEEEVGLVEEDVFEGVGGGSPPPTEVDLWRVVVIVYLFMPGLAVYL